MMGGTLLHAKCGARVVALLCSPLLSLRCTVRQGARPACIQSMKMGVGHHVCDATHALHLHMSVLAGDDMGGYEWRRHQ